MKGERVKGKVRNSIIQRLLLLYRKERLKGLRKLWLIRNLKEGLMVRMIFLS